MSLDDPMGPHMATPMVEYDLCPCGFMTVDTGRYVNCPRCRKHELYRKKHHALCLVKPPVEDLMKSLRGPISEELADKPMATDVEQRS